MTKEEFLTLFEEIIQANPGTMKGTERLAGIENWDSLSCVDLIAQVDAEYSVTLAEEQILRCKTVGDLAELLDSHIQALPQQLA